MIKPKFVSYIPIQQLKNYYDINFTQEEKALIQREIANRPTKDLRDILTINVLISAIQVGGVTKLDAYQIGMVAGHFSERISTKKIANTDIVKSITGKLKKKIDQIYQGMRIEGVLGSNVVEIG